MSVSPIITKGYGWGNLIITKGYGIEIIEGAIRKLFARKYYDAIFKIPVEKLSIAKEQDKVIDISQLIFEKEPIMSWEDIKKFHRRT